MRHGDHLSNPHLFFPRQNCVQCPDPPPCNCRADQTCERSIQTCSECAQNLCIDSKSSGGGVSDGALAGAVVGCILLLTIVVTAFFVWRRRARAKKAAILALEKNSISPYDLQGPSVLNSPIPPPPTSPHSPRSPHSQGPIPGSPVNDVRVYNSSLINLDASAAARLATTGNADPNPFSDAASTTSYGTNVIPIAYLPPGANSMTVADGLSAPPSATALPPARPARSPDLNLRLPPQAVSRASLVDAQGAGAHDLLAPRSPYAAQSTKSGVSRASSRASTISTASTTYERPTIVTSAKIGRQVLGVVRAEVVPLPQTPPLPGSPASTLSPNATPRTSTAAGLRARPSIRSPLAGPSFNESDIELRNSPSPPPMPSPSGDPFADRTLQSPRSPTSQPLPPSRPGSSMDPSSLTSPQSPTGENGGRLLTPARTEFTAPTPRTQHFPRESTSSFVSATSRADSIMNNAFVFFPPTPGSDRNNFPGPEDVPSRRTLGFSTGSNLSNASSGLDAFPFHFGPGAGMPAVPQSMSLSTLAEGGAPRLPQGFEGGPNAARASLDTLALSRDVEAYPLAFDRNRGDGASER